MTGSGISFEDIRGVTAKGEDISLAINVAYSPFLFEINDLYLHGNPYAASPFIPDELSREIYGKVWKDAEWDASDLPEIRIPSMRFTADETGRNWHFTLDGTFNARNAKYNGVKLDTAECSVSLDLPQGLTVDPIKITAGGVRMEGDCSARFGNSPSVVFSIKDSSGIEKPSQLIKAFSDEWAAKLEKLSFGKGASCSCTVSLPLDHPDDIKARARIEAPSCTYGRWTAEGLDAELSYASGALQWNVDKAAMLEGSLSASGFYSLRTSYGDALVIARGLDWGRLYSSIKKDVPEDGMGMVGKVDMDCSLHLMRNWAGRPFHLDGNGHFSLRNGDLWKVPLMEKLGRLLELSSFNLLRSGGGKSFGSITELDAEFDFNGTRLVVPSLYTDGTIISLSGSGEYSWEEDRLRFVVSGEPLKEISIISTLLKPLSWAFKAELKGTLEENQWQMKTLFSKD